MHTDSILQDPDTIRIYKSLEYDFSRSFGKPDCLAAIRSRRFDDVIKPWMKAHPGGTVVELACGLETSFQRCDDGQVRWLCLDLPESIAIRERFLSPTNRCRHLAGSALDLTWLDEVDASKGVFVTAQGLLMYFDEADVRRLIRAIVERFPGVELMFDVIPRHLSGRALKGFRIRMTPHYELPPMVWGAHRKDIEALLKSWSPRITDVDQRVGRAPLRHYRGLKSVLIGIMWLTPGLRNFLPSLVHVKTREPSPAAA